MSRLCLHRANRWPRARYIDPARLALALLAASVFVSCAQSSTRTCFPGGGAEVWVERHFVSDPSVSTSRATLTVRLMADSAGVPVGGWQAVVHVFRDTSDQVVRSMRFQPEGTASLEVSSGHYTIRIAELKYVTVRRAVTVARGERVEVELQRRHAAYCLGPVVRTGVARVY